MKNIVLSAVAVLAMSSFAVAGGDIAPVEEPVVVEPVVTDAGFYLGLAYGLGDYSQDWTYANVTVNDVVEDFTYNSVMVQAGYKFNQYVAIEARYWFGLDETVASTYGDVDVNVNTFGIYVKPMYPVTDAFDIYGLLGYADSTYDFSIANATFDGLDHYNGFSWGLGASYAFTDNVAVFVDYVNMYDDNTDYVWSGLNGNLDETISTWNFGVTYQF